MCGIAGFVQFEPVWNFSQLSQTAETLKHRGPDGFGFCSIGADEQKVLFSERLTDSGQYALAGFMHRRLSIIDPLPEGRQPMITADGKVALIFNGELYNYKKIRSELADMGIFTQTQTDSEVLLLAYRKWGKAVLNKMDGMWSFAILDLEKQVFFASADPAGIKPFYFSMQGQNLCFASEIKALFDFGLPKKINRRAAARFLVYGLSDESEDTFFGDIFRLRGGHFIEMGLQDGKCRIETYHQFCYTKAFDFQSERKEAERVEAIREMMVEMIGLRLQSDVPLGICLSGGIDSSAIAGLVAFADKASKNAEQRKAFMATLFPGDARNEEAFARMVAGRNHFSFHTVCPDSADFQENMADMIRTLDEPPPGLNAYSQYAVFRLVASQGVKVSLDGQGADEIFGGYPRHLETWFWEHMAHGIFPPAFSHVLKPALFQKLKSLPGAHWHRKLMLQFKPENQIFTNEILTLAGLPPAPEDTLNGQLYRDFTRLTLPFLLKAADRNSMRWSVESRMPFADFMPLAGMLFSIPGSAKIASGFSKQLLRRAAAPFLPEPVALRRDKIGFAAPNREWLSGLLEQNSFAFRDEFIHNKKFVQHASAWQKKPDSVDFQVLWRAIAFQKWLEIFELD